MQTLDSCFDYKLILKVKVHKNSDCHIYPQNTKIHLALGQFGNFWCLSFFGRHCLHYMAMNLPDIPDWPLGRSRVSHRNFSQIWIKKNNVECLKGQWQGIMIATPKKRWGGEALRKKKEHVNFMGHANINLLPLLQVLFNALCQKMEDMDHCNKYWRNIEFLNMSKLLIPSCF